MEASSALEDAIRKSLPRNVFPCSACGLCRYVGGMRPKGCRFKISGCLGCGHIMRVTKRGIRDLTASEAAALAASPSFSRIRSNVEDALKELIG